MRPRDRPYCGGEAGSDRSALCDSTLDAQNIDNPSYVNTGESSSSRSTIRGLDLGAEYMGTP